MQALSDAKAGENYPIKWMFGLPEVLEFLHSHHVEEGCDVQVIQKMTDGVIIAVQDTRFVLGNEIADRIQV